MSVTKLYNFHSLILFLHHSYTHSSLIQTLYTLLFPINNSIVRFVYIFSLSICNNSRKMLSLHSAMILNSFKWIILKYVRCAKALIATINLNNVTFECYSLPHLYSPQTHNNRETPDYYFDLQLEMCDGSQRVTSKHRKPTMKLPILHHPE